MKLLLIGAGPMAIEYSKVLDSINVNFDVVGRGDKSASNYKEVTGRSVMTGGLKRLENPRQYEKAIVAVSENMLGEVTRECITLGIKEILVEKPGGLTNKDILRVRDHLKLKKSIVYIGYNRRYYASVTQAKKIIEEDGGVLSFNFEFTEWSHIVEAIKKEDGVKKAWLLANSSHVIDLAFYLGGKPKIIESFVSGSLSWHPSGARYVGAGVSEKGAPFSYFADWEAPGRWGLDFCTQNYRLILRPLEILKIQKQGSVTIENMEIEDDLDTKFKPGLYLQTKHFLESNKENLVSLEEQCEMLSVYDKIAGN